MGAGMETPLASRCLVSGKMGLPLPVANLRLMIAKPVQAPRMRVPVASVICSSPLPRTSTRMRLSPRRVPPRVALTPGRPRWVLALTSKRDHCLP